MAYLENEQPQWCTFFVLTLFLGVRPDMHNGEIWELARCVAQDGAGFYFQNGFLHLPAEIAKKANLAKPRFPPTPPSGWSAIRRWPRAFARETTRLIGNSESIRHPP